MGTISFFFSGVGYDVLLDGVIKTFCQGIDGYWPREFQMHVCDAIGARGRSGFGLVY